MQTPNQIGGALSGLLLFVATSCPAAADFRIDDVRWQKVPKYHTGQQGIWLLHRGPVPASHGLAPKAAAALPQLGDALTAVNKNDYLPLEELGRVKALLEK